MHQDALPANNHQCVLSYGYFTISVSDKLSVEIFSFTFFHFFPFPLTSSLTGLNSIR